MLVYGIGKIGYSQSVYYKSAPISRADKSNTFNIATDVVSFTGKNVLPLTIRNARLTDIPAILQLDRLCFPEYVLSHHPKLDVLTRAISLNPLSRTVAIDKTNGRLVGYFHVRDDNTGKLGVCIRGFSDLYDYPANDPTYRATRMLRKDIWLDSIAVHPEAHGQKVGQQLMLEVFKKAAQQNAGVIGLGVEAHNEVAQKLYKKFGFFNLKRMRDFHGEGKHVYLMGVDINAPGIAERLEALRKEVGLSNSA